MIKACQTPSAQPRDSDSHFDIPGIQEVSSKNKPKFGERLARNLALTALLVLAITAVHDARLPSGRTVLTAVQDMVDTPWDDQLGKISFVSNLFPETVSVFFESSLEADLVAPCFGKITHAWQKDEPYIGYDASDQQVYAMADGQVMSIAHGLDEERILRVRHADGLESLYYNLSSVFVQEGDAVTSATCLGAALSGQDILVEVRRAGKEIDPTASLQARDGK